MSRNEVSEKRNVDGGEPRKKGRPVDSESLIEDFDDEAMDKDAERDIPPDAQDGQPEPDLGEQHGELIQDGEGENDKKRTKPTTIKPQDQADGSIDKDIKRDVESGEENAA